MPSLNVTSYTPEELAAGAKTPAMSLFAKYVINVDAAGYNKLSQGDFYSKSVKFVNTNGVVYHGFEQMTQWMRQLFGPFEKMKHDYHKVREIDNGDGTYSLDCWSTRNIWIKGKDHDGDNPDVSVPLLYSGIFGPDESVEGTEQEKLRITEVHLFWDTGMLSGLVPQDAVVFRQHNPFN